MIGLSGEIPLVSHSDVTSPFPPSGNGGYASNRDVPGSPVHRDTLIGIHSDSPQLVRVITADIRHTDANHTDKATFPTKHTYTYIKKIKKIPFSLSKKPIAKFRPHQMTGTSQGASQPSGESARIQIKMFPLFFHFFGGWFYGIFC